MSLRRMVLLSLVIGLGLTLLGLALRFAIAGHAPPDSTGGGVLGFISGVLLIYHYWIWGPVVDRIFVPPCGALLDILVGLGIPTIDLAVPVFAILWITTKLRAWRSASAHHSGTCAKCGYDLRGLPEPRCPECGTPFDPASVGPLGPPGPSSPPKSTG